MREYSTKIALLKNSRGVYSLDSIVGCASGMANEEGGCYHDCYAAKSSRKYGYDFTKIVLRRFDDDKHRRKVIQQINRIPLPFVRIGSSGDPSEDWEHTISIIRAIATCNKEIVVITRHWTTLQDHHLQFLGTVNVCFNTSVSALDKHEVMMNGLVQYNRLKPYCKSSLRVITCDFDTSTEIGRRYYNLQKTLLDNDDIIETVLRVGKSNPYLKSGLVRVSKEQFLGKNTLASKRKKSVYLGACNNCNEMCGVNVSQYPIASKRNPIVIQSAMFSKKQVSSH